jgi:hypothetical protein
MWPLDELNDESTDVRLTFGRRYGWHLREACDAIFVTPGDHGRIAALWVQQMLERGELYQDCDSERILLRLTVGPWTYDFDIYWDFAGGSNPVHVGPPDTLFRDCFAVTAADYAPSELAALRDATASVTGERGGALITSLPRLQPTDDA